jgi:hypothetical protein
MMMMMMMMMMIQVQTISLVFHTVTDFAHGVPTSEVNWYNASVIQEILAQ